MIIKTISYERRVYESVDDRGAKYLKPTKKKELL